VGRPQCTVTWGHYGAATYVIHPTEAAEAIGCEGGGVQEGGGDAGGYEGGRRLM